MTQDRKLDSSKKRTDSKTIAYWNQQLQGRFILGNSDNVGLCVIIPYTWKHLIYTSPLHFITVPRGRDKVDAVTPTPLLKKQRLNNLSRISQIVLGLALGPLAAGPRVFPIPSLASGGHSHHPPAISSESSQETAIYLRLPHGSLQWFA